MTKSFPTIHFFYDSVISSKDTEWSGCSHPLFQWLMEQMIFDSSYLLRPATFLEDVKSSLFNQSNISHPSLEVVSIFVKEKNAIIHFLK